jgi:Zc3h12a-like ribonuclease protein
MAASRESEQTKRKSNGAARPLVLVDGSNVAHSSEGDQGHLANITLVCDKLREEGYEPLVLVDAALRHQIDDRAEYERMVDAGAIRQAPAGTDADYFILSFARELDAFVVSNDRFRDRQKAFPDAAARLIRYMVVKNEVVLERRTGPRHE